MEGVRPDLEAGLDHLYRENRVQMVRLAFLLTGSTEFAAEIAQEAFLRLWPNLHQARDPVAYLRAIVANLACAHHRRQAIERRLAPVPPGPVLGPDTDETWAQLWALPERQRAALVLRFCADLDVAGVAAALGCRVGTAKSLIHRGIARLKEVLEP